MPFYFRLLDININVMPKVDFLFCNALTILFCSCFLVIRKKFYNACDWGGHGDKEGILEGFARNFKLLFCVFLSSRIRFFFVCELSVNFAPIKSYPDFSFCMFVFKCRWLSFFVLNIEAWFFITRVQMHFPCLSGWILSLKFGIFFSQGRTANFSNIFLN